MSCLKFQCVPLEVFVYFNIFHASSTSSQFCIVLWLILNDRNIRVFEEPFINALLPEAYCSIVVCVDNKEHFMKASKKTLNLLIMIV